LEVLAGERGLVAAVEFGEEEVGEVEGFIHFVQNEGAGAEEAVGGGAEGPEVFHIHGIGPEGLADGLVGVVVHHKGLEGAAHGVGEAQELESPAAEVAVDIAEEGLVFVEGHEFDFALKNGDGFQRVWGVFQRHEFRTLDVEFEKVHGAAEVEVVESLGFDGEFFGDDHEFREVGEEGIRGGVGLKQ
jgi:hypothetical protein